MNTITQACWPLASNRFTRLSADRVVTELYKNYVNGAISGSAIEQG